jgi:PPOX class probable F420-dependent enzyme
MERSECRRRLTAAPVATLVTIDEHASPHAVPVCFAVIDDEHLVTAVDHKPKRTTALRRLDNVRAHPEACVLVHHYEEDWGALWWVRADGDAVVVDEPGDDLVGPLVAKYPAYADRPPAGPAIVVTIRRWSGWSAQG